MAYSIFTEDEKDKMKDQLGSIDFTNQYMDIYSSNNGSKGLDDEIAAQNKALHDIINNQYTEENQIRDDYDSLGSRAGRFLQVFGAGLRGENASQVAQAQRDDLNRRLQNAQTRYKDRRDSASTQLKDLLNRKDALDKSKYEKERDQVKDQQFKEQLDYTKDKDNRLYNLELQKLQDIKNVQAQKEKQAIQDLQNQQDQREQQRRDLVDSLDFINKGKYEDTNAILGFFGANSNNAKLTESRINKFNEDYVRYRYPEIPEKDIPDTVRKLKKDGVLPNASDSEGATVAKIKGLQIGYSPSSKKTLTNKEGKKVVRTEVYPSGTPAGAITVYYFDDGSYSSSLD